MTSGLFKLNHSSTEQGGRDSCELGNLFMAQVLKFYFPSISGINISAYEGQIDLSNLDVASLYESRAR